MKIKGKWAAVAAAFLSGILLLSGCGQKKEDIGEGQTTETVIEIEASSSEEIKELETPDHTAESEDITIPNQLPDSVKTITDDQLRLTSSQWKFSIQFPDDSWYVDMSGDSSVESYSSSQGTVSIVHVEEEGAEDYLPYFSTKEQWQESLEHTGESADFQVESFEAKEENGIRSYRGQVSYENSYYQYGISMGYYVDSKVYQVEILMRDKDQESVKAAENMADSFQVLE